jgi:hypothetical protein
MTCRLCQRHVYLPYRALYKLYPIMLRDMALQATGRADGVVSWQEIETKRRENGMVARQ